MSQSVFLCAADDLQEGRYREFQIEAEGDLVWLVVTRRRGRPRAWINLCPHQGRPLNFAPDRFLSDDDQRLICAHHGAVFEPDEGVCVAGPCQNAQLREYPVEECDGCVMVRHTA